MSEPQTLGSEFSKPKINYLLFLFAAYFFMFFVYLGVRSNQGQASLLAFYMFFGLPFVVLFIVDNFLLKKNVDLPLDTISYEDNSPLPFLNNVWVQFIVSAIMSVLIFIMIKVRGQAFLKAPSFSLSVPVLENIPGFSRFFDSFISGVAAGVFETLMFWGAIFPILYAVLRKQGLKDIEAAIISVLLTAFAFTGYHWWVYGYTISALMFVFFLGIIWGILVYVFRSVIPLILTHFANNFAVGMFVMSAYMIQVLFQVI
jgi:membrane protease YdiL (CAAX protease family)